MKFIRALLLFFGLAIGLNAAEAPRIAPQAAAEQVAAGTAVLVDVREPAEWEKTGVAQPAVLLAKSDYDAGASDWTAFLEANRGKKIILYCHSGRRAGIVAEALAEKGFRVANAGGLQDWTKAGLPVRSVEAKK
ncbi:rhodanese-like domain-containing protein [Horticoccus luteus]|uniref:Rhodanese-like domain-containing protein n=1 Tax=Horticoccus luteus TaxID=2862869 RepID=A0A8F9TUD4_9BACT|nr:rhodanese-like domain-containing protein [Horticoccus luteus]QYM79246.1 rhodanese-like domain-containing protein [Horticoccus luteus]